MQKRDLYIDAVKGFAILGITFIHTVFWSGRMYVPDYVRILALLVDVPIFFFVSGITSLGNVKKTFIRLVKLQITYMAFVVPLFLFIYFWKGTEYNTLLRWFCHDYDDSSPFSVVMGSMWYLRVYIAVVLLGAVVLRYFPKRFIDLIIVLLLGVIVGFSVLPLNQLLKQVIF